MSTYATIAPILASSYGSGYMVKAMTEHLAARIDRGDHINYASREDMIVSVCWDWMTGGGTAEAVGQKIEAALSTTQKGAGAK